MSVDPMFRRLLGAIEANRELLEDDPGLPPVAPLAWTHLPETEDHPEYDADVHIPPDYEQPSPLELHLLFEPDPDGVYDVEWIVDRSERLDTGDLVIQAYRASDGMPVVQRAPFPLTVVRPLLVRNRRVVRGDPLIECIVPSLSLGTKVVEKLVREAQMELAQAVNAAIKGYMGAIGQSGQIAHHVVPVEVQLDPSEGYEPLVEQIVDALSEGALDDGDVVVISEKVISLAQRRTFPLELLYEYDPKATDREGRLDLLVKAREHLSNLTLDDLLLADSVPDAPEGPVATAGVRDPNGVAFDLAESIRQRLGVACDVVISDTDTGLDVREELINCITIGSTPLGATAGLVIYECMRVANAAEFCRGSSRGIPIVICKPHVRCVRRGGIGHHRGYGGRLDADRELLLGFA